MGAKHLWLAGRLWLRNDCVDLSAAFAYHSLQSFFPALLIALAWLSRVLGDGQILRSRLELAMQQWLPEPTLEVVVEALDRFSRQGLGAGLLGAFFLFISAGNIYLTLQRGADRLWWNRPYDTPAFPWLDLVKRFIWLRLKAFLVVLAIGLLVVMDQLLTTLRVFGSAAIKQGLIQFLPPSVSWVGSISTMADLLTSLLSGFVAAWLVLWFLPSRRVPILPLVPGASLIAVGLTSLNLLLGRALLLLGFRFQAYGVVGGAMLVILWIWLIGALLYYAQCLSVVAARRAGFRLRGGDPHLRFIETANMVEAGWCDDGP
ncbi:MAG: YihY/virulence factor BrkB family protein [Cyanobacteriota bacterium]|nr:YihY/virulence factor BrkB family protein [Cyanobacteriota bacterium]